METKRQPKAFARIGDVRFVLNGTTVTAQQRCVCGGSGRVFWHWAGRIGLEALMTAARHGLRSKMTGSRCARLNAALQPIDRRHEFWLSADDAKALLVRVDERQQVTP